MVYSHFENIFRNIKIPVIAYEIGTERYLAYMNTSAHILLNPSLLLTQVFRESRLMPLRDVLRFQGGQMLEDFLQSVRTIGSVSGYRVTLLTNDERSIPVTISASIAVYEGKQYGVLYLREEDDEFLTLKDADNIMNMVFQIAYHTADPGEAIDRILQLAGVHVHASRAYVFEEVSADSLQNTYEWCAKGVQSFRGEFQHAKKSEHYYHEIISGGGFVSESIEELPDRFRELLRRQGIRSLAVLPMFHIDSAIGFIGFDDCVRDNRIWQRHEVALLCNISDVVMSLILRRRSDETSRISLEVLKTITDNIDTQVYVNDIHTNEVIFLNKALADALGKPAEELIGKKCWKVLRRGMGGPCDFCPVPKMLDETGQVVLDTLSWEYQNKADKKWYLVRDSIIKWVDGADAHIETATEITYQKTQEQKLQEIASLDAMTGVYNREWGARTMSKMFEAPQSLSGPVSLCFLDLDGLKTTNDSFGHEAGDDLIVRTVETIRSCIRKSDIMFRWGGDEFVILLRCDVMEAHKVMESVQRKLTRVNKQLGKPYTLSFSYGITDFRAEGSVERIVSRADKLMYENKMNKRR